MVGGGNWRIIYCGRKSNGKPTEELLHLLIALAKSVFIITSKN